jgi:Bacteriophage tail sheath protein
MPVRPTFPGVYIEELPSGVRPVTAVATSTAAFIGTFRKGLIDEAVQLLSIADFEREYGGLERQSEASYAINQFFLNGGTEAWVVRIGQPDPPIAPGTVATAAAGGTFFDSAGAGVLDFFAGRRIRGASARNPGDWGRFLRLEVEHNGTAATSTFNLFVSEVAISGTRTTVLLTESFRNLSVTPDTSNNALEVVNQGSRLIQFAAPLSANIPVASGTVSGDIQDPIAGGVTSLDVQLSISAAPAITISIPSTGGTNFVQWSADFQAALRGAGVDPSVLPAHRAYFTGSSVDLLGDGSAGNPRRFSIRPGRGAQPFDPAVQFVFSAGDRALYGLDAGNPNLTEQPLQFITSGGADGSIFDAATNTYQVPAASFRGNALLKTGLYAIDDIDLVNIISMPDAPRLGATGALSVYAEAIAYAESRRSMIIVDIPQDIVTIDQMQTWLAGNSSLRHPNAAVYYPRTFTPDPLNQNRGRSLASSGTIGGLWARTDTARGVWKAPAGTDARLRNVESLTYVMTDLENGTLNPLGVNCLRNFPIYSNICWGARTLDGADALASDWKYVPVRRTTLFIEESLYRGTKWVVFEPNDEPLWSQIRLNVGAFMHDLFRKGAFQGTTPREAYFVKCDGETTTQTDIDNGIVNIEVGFAPLKPAEFVVIKIQQIARVTVE